MMRRVIIKDVGRPHAAEMTSLLPRSRFLFLMRDGRDVIDSLLHAASAGGWFARLSGPLVSDDEDQLDFIREGARVGLLDRRVRTRPGSRHPAELRRRSAYEDLLSDTASELPNSAIG